MKKLLLILLSIFTILNADAKDNLFDRAQKREQLKNKRIEQFNSLKKLNANVNVPTLTKYSFWDDIGMLWNPSDAIKRNYSNDRIESEYYLTYTLDDTSYRYVYTYNGSGQIATITYDMYEFGTGNFISIGRMTYSYANNGLRVTQLMEQRDSTLSNWVPTNRYTLEMNDKGAYTESKFEYYDNISNSWIIQNRYTSTYTYYQNTRKIELELDSTYNANMQSMVLEYKMVRNINSSGQIRTISYYDYSSGIESFEEYDSVFYDANGIPTDLIAYDPSNAPNFTPWIKLSNLIWNGNFNPSLDLFENEPIGYIGYAPGIQGWEITSRTTVIFPDNFGSRVQLEEEYTNNNYVPSYKRSALYDSHLNLIEESEEEYDASTSKWLTMYGRKSLFTYDMTGNATEKIDKNYSFVDSAYVNAGKYEYSGYISIAQGLTTNKNTLEAKLFPNPSTNGSVNINLKLEQTSNLEIVLSDVSGKIISTESIYREKGMNTIKLDGLNKGMYIVSIKSESGVFRTKLLVQ